MYKHDDSVNMIIRSTNPNEAKNEAEKEIFNTVIKRSALGLLKNYKNDSPKKRDQTNTVIDYLSKTMDGRNFTLLIKYLQELRNDVLMNETHKLTADSFLIFLDKLRSLTTS